MATALNAWAKLCCESTVGLLSRSLRCPSLLRALAHVQLSGRQRLYYMMRITCVLHVVLVANTNDPGENTTGWRR